MPLLAGAVVVLALLAQGLDYSVHSGLVLSRADTRTQTREWMLANIPRGAKVVVEPVSPDQWAREPPGAPAGCAGTRYRWCKWPSLYTFIDADGAVDVAHRHEISIENYVRTLSPALIGLYERRGYCWVVTGSTEQGRALADPRAVPLAIAYYRALAAQGQVVRRFSPYAAGKGPGRVQLRLELRLLPARLPAARAGDDASTACTAGAARRPGLTRPGAGQRGSSAAVSRLLHPDDTHLGAVQPGLSWL